jgi:membrane protein YqaA with SNARE-associated domain
VDSRVETLHLREDETALDEVLETASRFAWRIEYSLLIASGVLLTLFAIAFFYFSTDISNLKSWGYAGLFLINLIGAASILLPSPAGASVLGGGALLSPFLGIPAFIWVGVVAGTAEAIGECTGYAAGYGGRIIVEDKPSYKRIARWMESHGTITMFALSVTPNPLFDVAGLCAGAVRMPLGRFFGTVLVGKIIKDTWMAALASAGVTIFTNL